MGVGGCCSQIIVGGVGGGTDLNLYYLQMQCIWGFILHFLKTPFLLDKFHLI